MCLEQGLKVSAFSANAWPPGCKCCPHSPSRPWRAPHLGISALLSEPKKRKKSRVKNKTMKTEQDVSSRGNLVTQTPNAGCGPCPAWAAGLLSLGFIPSETGPLPSPSDFWVARQHRALWGPWHTTVLVALAGSRAGHDSKHRPAASAQGAHSC